MGTLKKANLVSELLITCDTWSATRPETSTSSLILSTPGDGVPRMLEVFLGIDP